MNDTLSPSYQFAERKVFDRLHGTTSNLDDLSDGFGRKYLRGPYMKSIGIDERENHGNMVLYQKDMSGISQDEAKHLRTCSREDDSNIFAVWTIAGRRRRVAFLIFCM